MDPDAELLAQKMMPLSPPSRAGENVTLLVQFFFSVKEKTPTLLNVAPPSVLA